MIPDNKLHIATDLAITLGWLAGAVVAAYLLAMLFTRSLARLGRRSTLLADVAGLTRWPLRATLMVIAATVACDRAANAHGSWHADAHHLLVILSIAAGTWVAASLVLVVERRVIARFAGGDVQITDTDRRRRKIRTQVDVLRRLTIAVVVVLGTSTALMTFPSFANLGKTLFASAGVLSVIAGLAAQTSLGAVFAGIQIAFSDAIRVGDVVVLEKEWGRIEEITLTYVVVHLWDERRMVLPTKYFTTTPFQNWTRRATELLGTIELDVDFTAPLTDMRAELERLLTASELWDGRVGVVQVTDAVGGLLRVRMLVSASNAGALFDLRCAVREGLIDWLQHSFPQALPRWRVELPEHGAAKVNHTPEHNGETAEAGLFTGSIEAEHRGQAFTGPGPAVLAETNHRIADYGRTGPEW